MKWFYCFIVLLILIVSFLQVSEGFTTFEIDYGTGIGPWWAQGAGLNRGFHRCICSSSADCKCINDNPLYNTSIYPQYYYN